jgi:prevent-host-death family protein
LRSACPIQYGPLKADYIGSVTQMTETNEISIGVTDFKAHCLALIEAVAQGQTGRVVLMKHNRPVAVLVPVERGPVELWGAMRGSVEVLSGTDLTQATGEAWEAET